MQIFFEQKSKGLPLRTYELNVSKLIFAALWCKFFLLDAEGELALNAINKNVGLLFRLVTKLLLLFFAIRQVSCFLSLLRLLLLDVAIIDLYFSLLIFVPDDILLLVFSTPSHHLYDCKLFHGACKHLLLFQDVAQLFPRQIGPHQIYHCAEVIKLSSALVIVVIFKGQGIFKDLSSSLWGPIGNEDQLALLFGDSYALVEHSLANIITFSRNKGVKCSFINNYIKLAIRIVHFSCIHHLPNHIWEFASHLLNHARTNIDIHDILIPILIHLIRKLTVSTSHHQNPILLCNIVFIECHFKLRKFSVPVEKTTFLDVSFFPKIRASILLPGIDCVLQVLRLLILLTHQYVIINLKSGLNL